VFDAKSKPAKFSGGEQRLLSVLSVIAMRPNTDLLIIDEPLNNLDFINARNISNLINKVIRNNPEMAVLMISHCRIFPFITREIQLTSEGIQEVPEPYSCHSCFGEPDNDGFYK
jgi:ABC-type dipeptide/oligopeptide/nickel transport system ATPase subunit